LIVFPNCKINIGLNILGKGADGYHNLETIFYPLPFYDVLEVIQHTNTGRPCELFFSGIKIEGKPEDNLCTKAYYLLKKDHPQLPPVKIYLHKTIPAGAGLGGGSADGAFMLELLNDKFQLHLSSEKLLGHALELGSDCPFFIINKPCYATGRGEALQPVDVDLKGYSLVLVNPGIHISTAQAFAAIRPQQPVSNSRKLMQQPVDTWRDTLINDFEAGIFALHPLLAEIKASLYRAGAVYASMTGTGSTIYGLFAKPPASLTAFDPGMMVKNLIL